MRRRGQTTTEYLLGISVLSIALAAVLITFIQVVKDSTESTGSYLTTSLVSDPIQQ